MTLVDNKTERAMMITSVSVGNFNKQLREIKEPFTIINSGFNRDEYGSEFWALIKFKKPTI